MKKKLTQKDVINLMKEEWDKKISSLLETDDNLTMTAIINGKKQNVISAGLKVKKDGLTYVVSAVNDKSVTLRRPDSKEFTITSKELEDDYERE
jgi:hypothetical protein